MDRAKSLQRRLEVRRSLLQGLSSSEPGRKRDASRRLKNAVIGSRPQKVFYLEGDTVTRLCAVLEGGESEDPVVLRDLAVAIGSLAYGTSARAAAVCQPACIAALAHGLANGDSRVVAACAQSLKTLLARDYTGTPTTTATVDMLMVAQPDALEILVRCLAAKLPAVSVPAAALLALCCNTEERVALLISSGGAAILYDLAALETGPRIDALESLAMLAAARPAALFQQVIDAAPKLPALFSTLLSHVRPIVRLLSACCLAPFALHQSGNSSSSTYFNDGSEIVKEAAVARSSTKGAINTDHVLVKALHALLQLTRESSPVLKSRTALAIATLVEHNSVLQEVACDADIVERLAGYFRDASSGGSDTYVEGGVGQSGGGRSHSADMAIELRHSALQALAAVCSNREEGRRAVIRTDLLAHIIESLGAEQSRVRLAAARCTKSLSRSVKNLRTTLVDAGLTGPLFALIDDPDVDVQIAASSTLCNLVMEFSPMKSAVMERGGIAKLVKLTWSSHPALRLNGVWGLKNLVFEADAPGDCSTKERVMTSLTYPHLLQLVTDERADICEQALGLLRNLVYGSAVGSEIVVGGCGGIEKILDVLSIHLVAEAHPPVMAQALFVACNLASQCESYKDTIVRNMELLHGLRRALAHSNSNVQLPALWVILNVCHHKDSNAVQRYMTLQECGITHWLEPVVDAVNVDVRNRAREALAQIKRLQDRAFPPLRADSMDTS